MHRMKLQPDPFEKIKMGQKTIELRLYDEKRRKINVGDIISFTNTVTGEEISARVAALHRFASFAELYGSLPLLKCGYTAENVEAASPADMDLYYPPEKQREYGVLGIELRIEEQQ